ncbi:MAG: ABC transporter permease [Patescibacteria group bacterium]|nr:ABC transporter permease [Patescibacteria group bacterium]MDE1965794.1 ABC transporter permease [Patescibacteria group bacterium]
MNAIYVMWLREVKRFIRSKSRIVGSLAQPLLFLLAFGYGFGAVYAKAGQGNYIEFLGPGIIGMSIIFTSIFNGMQVIWDRQFGFLKETLVAPVPRLAIMFGRTLGGATVASLQGVIVLIAVIAVGFRPDSWLLVIPAICIMLSVGLLFSALGIMVASLLRDMQGFQLIMNFLVMPLFFLSGALFPLDNVPPVFLWIARFDPLSYGVDAMRYLLIDTTVFGLALDVGVLAAFTALFLGLGSYFFSRIQI